MKIKRAETPDEIEAVRRLFREYEAYPQNPLAGAVYWKLKLR